MHNEPGLHPAGIRPLHQVLGAQEAGAALLGDHPQAPASHVATSLLEHRDVVLFLCVPADSLGHSGVHWEFDL